MLLHDYPTPAQTTVFIGDQYLDDAYSINFEIQQPRVPLYGYNQSYFSLMADGKILITGTLIINFRYPGYLQTAISRYEDFRHTAGMVENVFESIGRAGNLYGGFPAYGLSDPNAPWRPAPQTRQLNREGLRETLERLRGTDDPNERARIMARSMLNGSFRDVSRLAQLLWVDTERDDSIRKQNPAQITSAEGNFDIQVAYGDGVGPMRVDVLKNCHVTGMAKSMSSSAHANDSITSRPHPRASTASSLSICAGHSS